MTTIFEKVQQASQSRSALRAWFLEILSQLHSSQLALVNIWGNRGCGKTAFLQEIKELLENQPGLIIFGPQDAAQMPYRTLAAQILTLLDSTQQADNKVVLIDNLESLDTENGTDRPDFTDFEKNFLLQVMQRQDVLFVVTSPYELRQWHYIEIKMRHASISIPPIEPAEINTVAANLDLAPRKVMKLTYGYPAALDWLRSNKDATEAEVNAFTFAILLAEFPQEIQEAAMIASLLVDFDVAVFQRAVHAANLKIATTYNDYVSIIQRLGIAGLILYDIRNGGYRFADQATRRLLARICKSLHPDAFEAVHQEMRSFYQQEARHATFLPQFLVNAIYHMARADEHLGKTYLGQQCEKWIEQTIPIWKGAEWQDVLRAWKSGRGNPEIVEEITSLIGIAAYRQITRQIILAERAS